MPNTQILEAVLDLKERLQQRKEHLKTLRQQVKQNLHNKDYKSARAICEEILSLSEDDFETLMDLSEAHLQEENYQNSQETISKAMKLRPLSAAPHYLFRILAEKFADNQEVFAVYNDTISNKEESLSDYEVLLRKGNSALFQGNESEALAAYSEAVQLNDNKPLGYENIGFVYERANNTPLAHLYYGYANFYGEKYKQASYHFQKYIETEDGDEKLYLTLGHCFWWLKLWDDAKSAYQRGILLFPQSAALYRDFVWLLDETGNADEAIAMAEKGWKINPDDMFLNYQRHLILPAVYKNQEEIYKHRKRFSDGLETIIKETILNTPEEKANAFEASVKISTFYLSYQGENDFDLQQKYGDFIHKIFLANNPQGVARLAMPAFGAKEKKRIGYVSNHCYSHSVATVILGWLKYQNRDEFEVYCYYLNTKLDHVTTQFKRQSDFFYHLPNDFDGAYKQILSDNLHLIVYTDLVMSSCLRRLAAFRLAPVQCLHWGHPVTSGFPTIDYFLSGELLEPLNGHEHYTEKLIRLPNIGVSYSNPGLPQKKKDLSDFNLPDDKVLFVSTQSLFKYLPRYDRVFPKIASQVSNSRFIFFLPGNLYGVPIFQERLQQAFAEFGLRAEDFCIFIENLAYLDFLNLLLLADVYLDTIGWSGATTAIDGVTCGLPIVTCEGEFMRGRLASGILRMLQVTETIAKNEEEYVDCAVRLGLDKSLRNSVSTKIKENHTLLFDDLKCIEGLEDFYRKAVTNYA